MAEGQTVSGLTLTVLAVPRGVGRSSLQELLALDANDARPIFGTSFALSLAMNALLNKSTLEMLNASLRAKLRELTESLRDRSELAIENSADFIDTIRMANDRDLAVQRINLNAQTLHDVRAALVALDKDSYGICEDCAEGISPRRLTALPWARVCIRCQENRDRQRSSTDFAFAEAA